MSSSVALVLCFGSVGRSFFFWFGVLSMGVVDRAGEL